MLPTSDPTEGSLTVIPTAPHLGTVWKPSRQWRVGKPWKSEHILPWSIFLLGRIFLMQGDYRSLLHSTALLGMLDKQINQPQSSPEEGINVPSLGN